MLQPSDMQIAFDGHMPCSDARSVKKNDKPKKCKQCKKLLSKYNINDYCFAHVHIGAYKDSIAYDLKLQAKARAQARKALKSKKEVECQELRKKTTKVLKRNVKKQLATRKKRSGLKTKKS